MIEEKKTEKKTEKEVAAKPKTFMGKEVKNMETF